MSQGSACAWVRLQAADSAAPFFVGPQGFANDADPNPVDIDPPVVATYDGRLLLPEPLYVFYLFRLYPLELFALFWFKCSGVDEFDTLVTMSVSMIWGAVVALEDHRRRRYQAMQRIMDTELSENQQKTLRIFLNSLGNDSQVLARLRAKVGQLAPFWQFSGLTAAAYKEYLWSWCQNQQPDIRDFEWHCNHLWSFGVDLNQVGENYNFGSQDAEKLEVVGKHRMPQGTMDSALYFPFNMLCILALTLQSLQHSGHFAGCQSKNFLILRPNSTRAWGALSSNGIVIWHRHSGQEPRLLLRLNFPIALKSSAYFSSGESFEEVMTSYFDSEKSLLYGIGIVALSAFAVWDSRQFVHNPSCSHYDAADAAAKKAAQNLAIAQSLAYTSCRTYRASYHDARSTPDAVRYGNAVYIHFDKPAVALCSVEVTQCNSFSRCGHGGFQRPLRPQTFSLPRVDEDIVRASHWGTEFADLLIQWTQTLSWCKPDTALPPLGISWIELMCNFLITTQTAIPINVAPYKKTSLYVTADQTDEYDLTTYAFSPFNG